MEEIEEREKCVGLCCCRNKLSSTSARGVDHAVCDSYRRLMLG